MTRFELLLRLAENQSIRSLDLSMFDTRDIAQVALHRTEVLGDVPDWKRAVRTWVRGDEAPMLDIATAFGPALLRRAAAAVFLEYRALRPLLKQLSPRTIADIGCGYGFFGLLAQADLGASLTLIDTERSDERRMRFSETGAACADLAVARRFLLANGCPASRLRTLNPQTADITALRNIDLAVSFLACGFLFPIDAYRDFFAASVRPGGSVLLDIRSRLVTSVVRPLAGLGEMQRLSMAADGKAMRFQLVTSPSALSQAA
ncbi:class I SAM-dependent methyltransferase [Psychromarinibacter sp. S121]|uniref:class I SAM-dependent methyltransferase n=1 Tax=Psychromarinibacter sp. S121 TaxID=3415127 RepID=UPI003C7D07C8